MRVVADVHTAWLAGWVVSKLRCKCFSNLMHRVGAGGKSIFYLASNFSVRPWNGSSPIANLSSARRVIWYPAAG